MIDEEIRAALDTLVLEATDLLVDMEAGLLDLEAGGQDHETINSIFRAAHTIKGSAGLFGLSHIVGFTHAVESVLDRLREGEVPISGPLIGALLPCKDHLADLIASVGRGQLEATAAQAQRSEELLATLEPYLSAATADALGSLPAASAPETGATTDAAKPTHVSLRFGPESLRNGMDPISFIRYLSTMGAVEGIHVMSAAMPDAHEMDPERCYLGFELELLTASPVEAIEEVFDFVRDESDIRVLPHGSPLAAYRRLADSYGPDRERLQAILGDRLQMTEASGEAETSPATTGKDPQSPASPGGRTSAQPLEAPGPPAGAPAGARPPDKAQSESRTLRIDAGRLDRLIDTVGELVIAGAAAGLGVASVGDEGLKASVGEIMRLVEEVRDNALRLRMVPIGTTFSRFQRVVRDVCSALGKDVSLVISGGETEVDKALVEHIGDPLMHLVRNALDHGIEPSEVRVAAGKPARGTLELRASHDSGAIVVVIEDDGGGIDTQRVLAKAIERGLVEPNANLSEREINALIFEPGFSTAATVSDLSGRGVGMDVVKRNVTALRGTIEVDSRAGVGTTIRIRLPLTLAIIDGFLVGIGEATFVIPLDRVIECVELPAARNGRDFMDLRDEVLPLIRLRPLLNIPGERPRRENVVVVEHAGMKAGLVVDALRGEFQTVIKPLGPIFERVQGIGGSTILGNGDVALIVDVPMLIQHVISRQPSRV